MESIADSGDHDLVEANMQAITTIGLDIAMSVFQVHVVDAEGKVVLRQQLKRARVLAFFRKLPPCLIALLVARVAGAWPHSPPDAAGLCEAISETPEE